MKVSWFERNLPGEPPEDFGKGSVIIEHNEHDGSRTTDHAFRIAGRNYVFVTNANLYDSDQRFN